MARHSSLRASDADREAVTERLRQAAGEGRLEPEELEDRLHTALRARTYGELDRVVADLPPTASRRPRAVGLPSAQTASPSPPGSCSRSWSSRSSWSTPR